VLKWPVEKLLTKRNQSSNIPTMGKLKKFFRLPKKLPLDVVELQKCTWKIASNFFFPLVKIIKENPKDLLFVSAIGFISGIIIGIYFVVN
jgi:hypothetical protein